MNESVSVRPVYNQTDCRAACHFDRWSVAVVVSREGKRNRSPEPLEVSSDFGYCMCSDFLAAVPFSEHSVKHGGL